jgi:hypothetical protein
MLLSACPKCAMPRAEADIAKGACPLCGYVVGQSLVEYVDEPPPVVVIPEAAPVAPPQQKRPPRVVAVVSLTAIGLGFLAGRFTSPVKTVEVKSTVPVEVVKYLPAPAPAPEPPPAPPEVAPFPREVEAVAIVPVKPVEVLPGGVQLIRLNRPEEVYTMERIGEGNSFKLVGKVAKLVVSGVDGGATLDASELEVKTVSFNGKIEGNARIKVNSPNGNISFSKAIGGGAQIEVNASGGTVTFWMPGATISGGAKLRVTGKSIWFHSRIDGGSFIDVTVSKAGGLRFIELADGSKIHYRGEKPDDEVRITPGKTDDSSECKRLD